MKNLFKNLFMVAILAMANTSTIQAQKATAFIRKSVQKLAKANANAEYRLGVRVKNDVNNEVAKVVAKISPANNNSPKPDKTSYISDQLHNGGTVGFKIYVNNTMSFAADALGASYDLELTMLDSNGKQVGKTTKETVKVEEGNFGWLPQKYEMGDFAFGNVKNHISLDEDGAYIGDENSFTNSVSIAAENGSSISNVTFLYIAKDCDDSGRLISVKANYDSKTNTYSGDFNWKQAKCGLTILGTAISIENQLGDVKYGRVRRLTDNCTGLQGFLVFYRTSCCGLSTFEEMWEAMIKNPANGNQPDSCDTKYNIKNVSITTSNTAGVYAMQFSFNLTGNSDVPDSVRMVVQLQDCSGQTSNIQISLIYNAATGTYTGGQAIKQDSKCPWALSFGEIGTWNPCSDFTFFSFTDDQSNGKGPRQVATSNNGSPGLL